MQSFITFFCTHILYGQRNMSHCMASDWASDQRKDGDGWLEQHMIMLSGLVLSRILTRGGHRRVRKGDKDVPCGEATKEWTMVGIKLNWGITLNTSLIFEEAF